MRPRKRPAGVRQKDSERRSRCGNDKQTKGQDHAMLLMGTLWPLTPRLKIVTHRQQAFVKEKYGRTAVGAPRNLSVTSAVFSCPIPCGRGDFGLNFGYAAIVLKNSRR